MSILALLTQGDSHKLCFQVKYANFNVMLSLSTDQNHYSFIFSILNHKWIFFLNIVQDGGLNVTFIIDRIICLLCVYICHYIFPFYYLDTETESTNI